ncbi:transporter substrate-binding domain-containing protein [Ideonella sp. DXS29W]|uniref:Transporter substrate-binding domain-containing protein n=1 Tax=Ideonella lacteola TaxID=2984193 RepID=A0ABU9BTB5_9BURK
MAWAWAGLALTSRAPARAAGVELRVVTEELPPYNMTQGGQITGMSTEVVQAVMKEVGIQAPIKSMPWARAYDIARNEENVLIYSITRTTQREKLFKWVGVISPTQWYLFALPGRHLGIRQLDDARRYQTATVNEDAGEQYLIGKGFEIGKNLQSSNKYEFNYQKLKLGRVDLWIAAELNAHYLSRQAGDNPETALVRVLPLPDLAPEEGLSMAFSLKTSDAVVERFRKGLDVVRRNGTYDAIRRKWQS